MELLGNQKVNVFVVFFQRSEAVGIPGHKKWVRVPSFHLSTWRHGRPIYIRLGLSPSARFRLLYCKMRGIDEASFLEFLCSVSCRPLPAARFRVEVACELRRHRSVRANRNKLAQAPCLRNDRRRSNYAS